MSKKSKNFNSESNGQEENLHSKSSTDENVERDIVFDSQFLSDLTYWVNTNRKIALRRLLSFVEEIRRNPFTGTGKPERLKYQDTNICTSLDRIRPYCLHGS